jgi:hypothetical protein
MENGGSTITMVVDATGSMGASIEATQDVAKALTELLKLLGVNVIVITYGDYHTKDCTPEKVTTVHDGEAIGKHQFRKFPNGAGGDIPEAVATAMWGLCQLKNEDRISCQDPVVLITDAPPHDERPREDNPNQARFEKMCLKDKNFPSNWKKVCEEIKDFENITTLCSKGVYQDIYKKMSEFVEMDLTKENVMKSLLKIVNDMLEENIHLKSGCGGDVSKEKYLETFQTFAKSHPEHLGDVTFLANKYFEILRYSREFQALHSKFCLEYANLPKADKGLLQAFKDAQANSLSMKEVLFDLSEEGVDLESGLTVKLATTPCSFGLLKDILVGNIVGKDAHREFKRLFDGLRVCSNGTAHALPLNAIKANPCLLASLFCMNPEKDDIQEFGKGTLPILASAAFQFCKNPELVAIFKELFEDDSATVLSWARPGSAATVPDTWWNRPKLQFLIHGLKKLDIQNPSFKKMQKVLERLSRMVEITSLKNDHIPMIDVERKLENMSLMAAVDKTDRLFLSFDPLLQLWFVPTITFHQTHEEVLDIIRRVKQNYDFYEIGDEHLRNVEELSKEMEGLYLSIYSINAGVGDRFDVPESHSERKGYMDSYAKESFVKFPSFPKDGELRAFYLRHVGRNAENILTKRNTFRTEEICTNGPQMVYCGKKGCGNCYFRQDSSALDRLNNTRCGSCRKARLSLPTHEVGCESCDKKFVVGFDVQGKKLTADICPFCTIPQVNLTIDNVPFFSLIRDNMSLFSAHLGIPIDLLEKITFCESMAKVFRGDPTNPDSSLPLPESVFQDHLWSSSPQLGKDVVMLFGCDTLSSVSKVRVLVLLENKFHVECGICVETIRLKDSKLFCSNKKCREVCATCLKTQLSQQSEEPNASVQMSCLECPFCRKTVKKGYLENSLLRCMHNGEKGESGYQKWKENPQISFRLCANYNSENSEACAGSDTFPFEVLLPIPRVEEEEEQQQQQEEETENMCVRQTRKPPFFCQACISRQVEQDAERLRLLQKEREEICGKRLVSGHYLLVDEATGSKTLIRKCPKCAKAIEKSTGCDHMTCHHHRVDVINEPFCDAHFCWRCGKMWDGEVNPFAAHPCWTHTLSDCPFKGVDLFLLPFAE